MESLDLRVLADALAWRREGHHATLVTVVETWGSAPRPPGALLAVRDDGVVSGSVSGGCVEDDLIARVKAGEKTGRPSMIAYGVSKEEAARFGLPCGGTLRLVQEPVADTKWIEEVLARTTAHELVARTLTPISEVMGISRMGKRLRAGLGLRALSAASLAQQSMFRLSAPSRANQADGRIPNRSHSQSSMSS